MRCPFMTEPQQGCRAGCHPCMLASAGRLIETTVDGKPALQLTPKGAQVATWMAMDHEDDAAALLDAAEAETPAG